MAQIILDEIQVLPTASGYAANATFLRVWYNRTFQDSDGRTVVGGNGSTGFYIISPCTVDENGITADALNFWTTVDANDAAPQSIQCFARFFSNNTPKDWLFNGASTPLGWVVYNPDPLTTWTLAQLQLLNQTSYLANPPQDYPTTQEMIDYVNSIQYANAGVNTKGITKLSVAPISSTNPIALGANDPRVLEEISLSRYSTLALAAAAAGTTKQLVIDTTTAPSSTLDLSGVVLRFVNGGSINPTTGITVTLGAFTAPRVSIFGGAGNIRFAGKSNPAFYPEWWSIKDDAYTANDGAINR
jgi:hypothetical protein